MITFHNPGELDPRFITTFGVSIKESSNPIGFFGTGLKYALAVLLRTGHEVEIRTGPTTFTFSVQQEIIRGKEVSLVYMQSDLTAPGGGTPAPIQLPFSTDLGRNWEVWMAYRELACNAMDEGGGTSQGQATAYLPGCTYIEVTGKPISLVHTMRHKYFLTGTPLFVTESVEVYARSGKDIFYRGVKVGEHEHPGLYTYNLLCQTKLTEDRTIAEMYDVRSEISSVWYDCEIDRALEEILTARKTTNEGNFEFAFWSFPSWKKDNRFAQAVRRLVGNKATSLNTSARQVIERHTPKEKLRPTLAKLTPVEGLMLARAKVFLVNHFDVPGDTQVHVAANLGDDALGLMADGEIWVSRKAFSQGTKMLAGTIYEEWIHREHNLADESRGMQNFLLDRLMSMAEQVAGEPL